MNSSSREEVIKSTRRRGGLGESKQIQAVWRKAKGKRSAKEVDKLEADKTRNLALYAASNLSDRTRGLSLIYIVIQYPIERHVPLSSYHSTSRFSQKVQFVRICGVSAQASDSSAAADLDTVLDADHAAN